ncbi:pilus assembly protein TadG-related protein [Thermoflexus sp.]|uniref:pilus assembly protein TadG-related protein n=1 Tax=Thermoflexus sp. TaxID=1969742 RepID=UPI002ADD4228|nr:pilus assembly protein TadG-related protein [Thermoflexus sp.]
MRREAGFSYAWTAMLLMFLLVPLMWMGIQIGRLQAARGELQKAADAAAEAAAAMVDIERFKATGGVAFAGDVFAVAQRYALANAAYLTARGVFPRVSAIVPDNATRTVRVVVEADVSPLLGLFGRVRAEGTSQVRSSVR